MENQTKDRYLINSIIRACNIMKCIANEKGSLKASDFAAHLRLDRSTVYRILLSLESCGFIEKDEDTGGYTTGIAAFEFGNVYVSNMNFIKKSRPVMLDLSVQVQEAVHLGVLSGTEMVVVDKVDSPRSVGMICKIGHKAPGYCTAMGKVLLANRPEDELAAIVQTIELKPFTKGTITSRKRFMEEMKMIRTQGYAFDDREHEEDVECIAAPIMDHHGHVIAAVSISGPQRKIDTPQQQHFINLVVEAASQISSKMGYLK
ncbi:MAG: IclR family transcriptional regulator [Deltaproteobacteria bacterium]|nr:IclR family transcriptional regulator [Deltaproteobacteria bacterium]